MSGVNPARIKMLVFKITPLGDGVVLLKIKVNGRDRFATQRGG